MVFLMAQEAGNVLHKEPRFFTRPSQCLLARQTWCFCVHPVWVWTNEVGFLCRKVTVRCDLCRY